MAFGLLGGIAGAGAAAGPLIGGFVTTALRRRVVFAAETVVMLGILLLARRIRDAPPAHGAERDVRGVALAARAPGLVLAGTFFVLPLYLQIVLGKDALQTGIKILPISVTMMIAALAGPRLAVRLSPRRIVQIGLGLLFASELGLMSSISPELASPLFA